VGDNSVRVNPMHLIQYGTTLAGDLADAQGQLADPLTGISEHNMAAFGSTVPDTHPFAEGLTAMTVVIRNLGDFRAFLKDVGTGTQAIQSAATAMAVVYATTDGDQADNLNAVDFAFAEASAAPAGFPTKGVSTMFDQQMAAQEAAGQNTAAALAADDPSMLQWATLTTPIPGGSLYTFADGSRLAIANTVGQSLFISSNTKTVSIYRSGQDKPTSVVTTGDSTDYSGQPTSSKSTQTLSSSGQYVTSSESTTHLVNGDVQVTTTTTGTDGKPKTTTVTVTPERPTTDVTDLGEIEKLEKQYNSTGSLESVRYGR
jgi:hypothetical protein